jgi:3-hydroxyisobutyrate dehydrogenase
MSVGDRLVDDAGILFVGIGAMGEPMATQIAAAGYRLFITDAAEDRAVAVAEGLGAVAAVGDRLDEELPRIRTVVLMLPSSAIVEAVLLGDRGLLDRLEAGSVVIDMSSSSPASTRRLATTAAGLGLGYLDAPVSGGVPKARTGELTIMVGGDAAVLESRRELLSAMGSVVTHVGGPGTGDAMKALNNLLSAIGLVGAAEVLTTAARFGIEPRVALDVLNSSTGRNQATEVKYGRYVLSRAFDSGFAMQLMVKDLRIALEIAHEAGVPVPISANALEEWTAAIRSLGDQADHTAIANYVEARAGVQLTEPSVE